ncbi:MAG: LptF/LptG family permease, partial [Candidatus Zixiibacteriota bacterium]
MLILSRYVIREHIGPFFFGLFIITFVFILNIIFRDFGRILGRGLGIRIILEFLFLNLAWIVALAVPMAVLIATLMAFGRLSSDNEITAVKAGGVSFLRLISPVLIVSAILAYLLVEFNNRVLPEFNHQARLLTSDIFRKRPTLKLEPNVILHDIPHYNLTVREVKEEGDSSKVAGVIIDDKTDPNINKTIIAKRGIIKFDEVREMLVMTLFNGEMHEIDLRSLESYRKLEFEKQVVFMSIPGMVLKRSHSSY